MTTKEDRPAGNRAANTSTPLTGKHSARDLHKRGLHVFPADHPRHPECIGKHGPESPCDGHRGKHPAVTWGTWAHTVTDKMIELEWGRYRGLANIGISCGPSNLVVLDEDALGEIERWCATYGVTLPDTYTVTTGRGRHLYFYWEHTTQRIGNSSKAMKGFKIDVRGYGGFVVAEGSRHESGALYSGNGQQIAELPDRVAELLLAGDDVGDSPEPESSVVDLNTAKIGYRQRHTRLVAYASRLRKSGLDYEEVESIFRQRWLCCEQPEGQLPEARYHSASCLDAIPWKQAKAKLRDVYDRYPAGRNLDELPAVATTRLADVEPEQVSWLWRGRLPAGKQVTFDGDPGLGKSTLAAAIAGPVTTGGTWPDGTVCEHPGAVLIMSAEDGLADTIRPRLDAAGADVTKVHAIQGVPIDNDGTLRPPTIADIAALESAIKATDARLLIIDVLMAYLPSGTDSHKDQDIRATLSRLSALAERTGCTVLLLRHLNKTSGRNPVYRGGGSIGIVGAARAGFMVGVDPEDDTRRVLACVKSNLAPTPESLAFRLVDSPEHGCARVVWDGSSEHTAHTLLAEPDGDAADRREIDAWLRDYLEFEGQAKARDVIRDGKLAGFSEDQIKKARKHIGAVSERQGFGPGSAVVWKLTARRGHRGRVSDTGSMAPMGCIHCGLPVTSGQTDSDGQPAHLKCQQTNREKGKRTE